MDIIKPFMTPSVPAALETGTPIPAETIAQAGYGDAALAALANAVIALTARIAELEAKG
jgi:hypothetical protein